MYEECDGKKMSVRSYDKKGYVQDLEDKASSKNHRLLRRPSGWWVSWTRKARCYVLKLHVKALPLHIHMLYMSPQNYFLIDPIDCFIESVKLKYANRSGVLLNLAILLGNRLDVCLSWDSFIQLAWELYMLHVNAS